MNLWGSQRPFWVEKLGQLWKLVRESHAQPLAGEAGLPVPVAEGETGVMFLGHSSFLLSFGARSVLIDPVFSTRLVLLRRQRRPGVRVADLPALDVVLVTHAHMDHLNRVTLRKVARATRRLTGQGPVIIVPRGVEDLVAGLGFREVRTLEWWQSTTLEASPESRDRADELRVTLTPSKHWGARMFRDTHRGFGGYMIEQGEEKIYHSGDTAYFGGFREIRQRLGAPRVALMPIGAYFPDSYRAVHTSPEEAIQAFCDVGAERMVPMHFGTFRLGREPMDEPVKRLVAEAARRGIVERVRVLREGETMLLDAAAVLA